MNGSGGAVDLNMWATVFITHFLSSKKNAKIKIFFLTYDHNILILVVEKTGRFTYIVLIALKIKIYKEGGLKPYIFRIV